MIQTHPHMLDEILSKINSSNNIVSHLNSAYDLPYVRYYMELAVSDQWTTLNVEDVNLKEYNYHRSMAGAFLLNRQTVNIVKSVIMAESATLAIKLVQFKALSEMLYKEEAIILKHILIKDLSSLYSNITHEFISESLGKQ